MKQRAEKMTEQAVECLLKTAERWVSDTSQALDEMEQTHSEPELEQSKQYQALVAGHFTLKEMIERITNQLNK